MSLNVKFCRNSNWMQLRLALSKKSWKDVAQMMKQFLQRLGRMVRNQIEQEISPEMAYCEFECREPRCPVKGWAACPKRLRHLQQVKWRQQTAQQHRQRVTAKVSGRS